MQQPFGAPRIPPAILDNYASWVFTPVSVHESKSIMYRLAQNGEIRFLKVVRNGWFPSAEAEAKRAVWARDYIPVPEIIEFGISDDTTWLLSSGIVGADATSERFRSDIPGLVQRLGAALRYFHAMPVVACPFSFRLDDALMHAHQRLRRGEIDSTRDFHPEHVALTPSAAVRKLMATRPASEDVVVCHGDYCVPNILFRDTALAGFVDLGELGTADRWWDLAVATWSVTWNFGPGYETMLLDSYGVELDEERSQFYRLLYDVVS
jgi:kanamycin kinase